MFTNKILKIGIILTLTVGVLIGVTGCGSKTAQATTQETAQQKAIADARKKIDSVPQNKNISDADKEKAAETVATGQQYVDVLNKYLNLEYNLNANTMDESIAAVKQLGDSYVADYWIKTIKPYVISDSYSSTLKNIQVSNVKIETVTYNIDKKTYNGAEIDVTTQFIESGKNVKNAGSLQQIVSHFGLINKNGTIIIVLEKRQQQTAVSGK